MVNFLAMYLEDLQKLLIPIYALTKKSVKFVWGPEQQEAFEAIKEKVTSPPVLAMPNTYDPFIMFSDTSKIACGAALYQLQKGVPRLVAYNSKKLIDAASRYSISELELCGLIHNIEAFEIWLDDVDFTVYVDHSALVHMLKGKKQPKTLRLKKMIESLQRYSFTVKYHKGKDMKIADFLSRHPQDVDDPDEETEPLSLTTQDLKEMVDEMSPDTLARFSEDVCAITTRSMARHQEDGSEDDEIEEPRDRHVAFQDQPVIINDETEAPQKNYIPDRPSPQSRKVRAMEPQFQVKDPTKRTLPRTAYHGIADHLTPKEVEVHLTDQQEPPVEPQFTGTTPGLDPEKEVEYPDMTVPEEYKDKPNKALFKSLSTESILRQHLPQQKEVEQFIELLKRKVIHGYRLPLTLKELKASYTKSPFFKDIYIYIARGYSPFKGYAQRTFKNECENYIIFDGILFKIIMGKAKNDEPRLTMCVTEAYIPVILYQYHDMLLAGHQGVLRSYLTIKEKYFFPHMIMYLRRYIKSCLVCQTRSKQAPLPAAHYPRIPMDYRPMSNISLDAKEMPMSTLGYKHILVCTCEVSNYVVAIPIQDLTTVTLFEALFYRVICVFGSPAAVITDEGKGLISNMMAALYRSLNIKPFTISPHHHGSLRTERYIQTMNNMLCKYLTGQGANWPLFVYPCMMAMNTFVSPLTGYSPYELVFLKPPPLLTELALDPEDVQKSVTVPEYMDLMRNRYQVMRKMAVERKVRQQEFQSFKEVRKHPNYKPYGKGDLVLFHYEYGSELQTNWKKLKQPWIGPVKIQAVLDDTHFLISDWEGKIPPVVMEEHRLKPFTLNLGNLEDEVTDFKTLQQILKQVHDDREKLRDHKTPQQEP